MAQSTIRRVKEKLDNYITISDLLGNYIIDGSDMDENTFSELAEKIPNEDGVVKAFELAPEGIITEIYPMQGNSEALGLDVLGEHERKKDAALAKETGEYTLGGPYQLKQGGTGALLFKPVYRNDDSGESSFWGFVLQVIDWDRFMSDINLKSLSEADFSYKIWSYDRSSGDKVILAQSQDDMPENSLTIECEIPNNTWYFDIVPSNGWIPVSYWLLAIAASYIFSLLVATIYYQISGKKHREKQYAADLKKAAELAKSANEAKTRFLFNMSHDIRTPMNGIIGMVELANRYPNDPEMQQKCRDKIMESSRYLVSLVNDILDMNKLESGDIVDQELTFDLTEILSRSNTEKQLQAAEKNIEYIVDWERSKLSYILLTGNPVYLERLLNAISDNAVKFTKPGGRIHVWCKEKFADEKQVVYEFGCADNGPGMSQEFVAHAFDLFTQEKETSRSKYEGTGLGLSIAKKLTDRMGGTIRIESKEGTGTTVIMTIPFKIGEAEKARKLEDFVKDPNTISLEGLRALVVEDNELNMEIASFMLEDNGIIVDCAKDGLEAIGKFEKSEPGYYDVILMDIMMPNLNGWDTTRRIRSMKRSDAERVPVIAMSANAFAENIINSRISGMDEHLTKPLEPARLVNVLKDCIWRRKHKL